MRADMDKVIVERPRIGSRRKSRKKGYRRHTQSIPFEDRPQKEPMLGRWRGRDKWLNEHLGPMKRFLRSNVGRPWNKVHQELCEHVSFDNAVQSHVLDHIYDFVNQHVELEDSATVYSNDRVWVSQRCRLRTGAMYVCPRTGLLKTVRASRSRRPPRRFHPGGDRIFLHREELWWEIRLREPPSNPGHIWDVWLEKDLAALEPTDLIAAYGVREYAVSKRPLSRGEAKQLYKKIRRRTKRR